MSNRFGSIFVVLCGLLLAPQMLALDGVEQTFKGREQGSESDQMTWSGFWVLFGYERSAKQQAAIDHDGGAVVQQNPLYTSQSPDDDSVANEEAIPAEFVASAVHEETIDAPVPSVQPPSAQSEEIKEEITAPEQSPALVNPVPEDLMESRVVQFADANRALYQRACDRYSNDKTNPLVFHITNGNPDALWLGLINLGLDKNEITEGDLMWIINQYAKPASIQTHQAEQLFKDVILAHLKGAKALKITKLLTTIAIKPKNGYFSSYSKNEKFNVLVNTVELGYYNERYTKAFQEIVSLLPAEKIDNYDSVSFTENDKATTLTLASWLMRDKGYYVVKGYPYAIAAAIHMFSHRLKHNVSEGTLDLEEPIASLATVLLKGNHIQQDQYGVASRRFITQKAEKKE